MGGFGSGRWPGRKRREIVENCQRVSSGDLPGSVSSGERVVLPLRDPERSIIGYIPCDCRVSRDGILSLTFKVRFDGESLIQVIPLAWTAAGRGGCRLCFRCPFPVGERICGRRSRVLYSSPGSKRLGCRHCHRLGYASSQRRNERLARSIDASDDVEDETDNLLARIERDERVEFHELFRVWRRLSHTTFDLWESLRDRLA